MGSFGYDLKAEMRVWLVEFQGLGGFRLRWACRMEFYECGAVSKHFIDDILVFSSLCFQFLLKTPCKVECTLFSPIISVSPPSFAQWNSGCLSVSSKHYHTQRQSSSTIGLLAPLGGWDSHFSRHQPINPSSEPSPFYGIPLKNRWSWKLFSLPTSLIPALEDRNLS